MYYLKLGNKYVKRTKNRRISSINAILGTKEQAKVYNSLSNAKKAKTAYEYQYNEFTDQLVIAEVN